MHNIIQNDPLYYNLYIYVYIYICIYIYIYIYIYKSMKESIYFFRKMHHLCGGRHGFGVTTVYKKALTPCIAFPSSWPKVEGKEIFNMGRAYLGIWHDVVSIFCLPFFLIKIRIKDKSSIGRREWEKGPSWV
jgi:hypothetical protein